MFHIEERLIEIVGPCESEAYIVSLEVIFNVLPAFLLLEVLSEIKLAVHNGKSGVIVKPLYTLAVFPESVLRF